MEPSTAKCKNRLQDLLQIEYPIIQGAMANITTAEFAASVSNAGALGIIATGAMDPDLVREQIRKCRSLTDKPFGVNVMMMNPHTPQIFEVIAQEKVAVVTCGAGNPGPYMAMLKESGCKVIPVVASVALATRLARAGADAIVAEGTEAGGHVNEQSTMALVPQVVDAVDIPVIAAGGIADGRGMNAAFCLGASGVQIGTCLLATEECPIHDNYKEAVLKAKDRATVVTGRSLNVPVRILNNKMAKEYVALERAGAGKEELEKLTLGGLRRAVLEGDVDRGSVMMGQIAGLCKDIVPVKSRIADMAAQAKAQMAAMQDRMPW